MKLKNVLVFSIYLLNMPDIVSKEDDTKAKIMQVLNVVRYVMPALGVTTALYKKYKSNVKAKAEKLEKDQNISQDYINKHMLTEEQYSHAFELSQKVMDPSKNSSTDRQNALIELTQYLTKTYNEKFNISDIKEKKILDDLINDQNFKDANKDNKLFSQDELDSIKDEFEEPSQSSEESEEAQLGEEIEIASQVKTPELEVADLIKLDPSKKQKLETMKAGDIVSISGKDYEKLSNEKFQEVEV